MAKKQNPSIEPKLVRRKISDYIPDAHNPNQGTERGLAMIEDGLNELGAGRSIVVDADGNIVAGNKTLEAAQLAGITDVIEVPTDGHALIVHKREDWNLEDETGPARRYSFLDNQSGLQMAWDVNQIVKHAQAGANMQGIFYDWEMDKFAGLVPPVPATPSEMWNGMPEFENEDKTAFRSIVVHFTCQEDVDKFMALMGQPITDKTKYIYYPRLIRANLKRGQVVDDESGDGKVEE